jgi:hypothetical protein
MRRLRLRWYYALAPLAALLIGYLTGQKPLSRDASAIVPRSSLVLEYPKSWHVAAPPAMLSSLGLKGAIELAPRGERGGGGLLAAAVSEEGSLLPRALLAKLDGDIEGEAVSLVGSSAFRYSGVSIDRSHVAMTAYSIPTGLDQYTFALCFAPSRHAPALGACEQIVESGQVPGQASDLAGELAPDAGYAKKVGAVLATLAQARKEARAKMAGSPTAAVLELASTGLSDAFADAARALGKLDPPPVAAHAAAALERQLSQAKLAYAALASAAAIGSSRDFALARESATRAEAGVRSALQSFRLLGYRVA